MGCQKAHVPDVQHQVHFGEYCRWCTCVSDRRKEVHLATQAEVSLLIHISFDTLLSFSLCTLLHKMAQLHWYKSRTYTCVHTANSVVVIATVQWHPWQLQQCKQKQQNYYSASNLQSKGLLFVLSKSALFFIHCEATELAAGPTDKLHNIIMMIEQGGAIRFK